MTAFSADSIESTTVVGYQQKDTVSGFNFLIPTFSPANGGKVNIQDIKITNATDWSDSIQILDDGGATIATYFYASAKQSGLKADGWLAETGDALANRTLEPGQGVLIDTADVATITIPGIAL